MEGNGKADRGTSPEVKRTPSAGSEWITTKVTGKALGVSPRTVLGYIRSSLFGGGIKGVKRTWHVWGNSSRGFQGVFSQRKKARTSGPSVHSVELDALRGIAILGVVLSHIALNWVAFVGMPLTIPILRVNALDLLVFGYLGVTLFFLLSGYLLTWTEEKRARSSVYSVKSYALRRALRLAPAYYVAILIIVMIWPIFIPIRFSIADVAWHLAFLHGLNPFTAVTLDPAFWSLMPEVVFYCLLPFIILKLPRLSQRLVLFGALALVSLATRVYLAQVSTGELPVTAPGFNFWYLYFLPTTHLYLFLAGVLLRKMVERLSDWRSRLRAPLATALLLISGAFLMMFPYLGKRQSEVLQSPLAMLVDLMVIAFFTAALLGSPLLSRLLGFRLLRFVGMISYSLFLLNETVLLLAAWFLFPDVGLWLVGRDELVVWAAFFAYMLGILVYSITISYLSFRYIESPFLRYKPK